MISILIPTYNRSCYVLAKTLSQQCSLQENLRWEVVLVDDGSTDAVSQASNKWCEQLAGVRMVRSDKNMGRAAIRNFAVSQAVYEWVLFLDDDVMPANENFVAKYVRLAQKDKYDVICGGVNASKEEDESSLRWIYDAYAEEKYTLEWRRNHPYACFTAQNFMARKSVFDKMHFDSSIKHYGYEDALFGLELEINKFRIRHSVIPVVHLGIESNSVFVSKTERALQTLHKLGSPMTDKAAVSRLSKWFEDRHLAFVLRTWHFVFGGIERSLLCSKFPSVHLFQLYKLGYYARLR